MRKKWIRKLRKVEQRNWTMKYLINSIGKRPKNPLKTIEINSESGDNTWVLHKREQIENTLISQNIKYYTKVMKTKAYQDKIYQLLNKNEVWDRILNRELRRE